MSVRGENQWPSIGEFHMAAVTARTTTKMVCIGTGRSTERVPSSGPEYLTGVTLGTLHPHMHPGGLGRARELAPGVLGGGGGL